MKRANEPASPVEVCFSGGELRGKQTDQFTAFATGLTIREHFAGLAMQGLLANPGEFRGDDGEPAQTIPESAAFCARLSVIYADALLAELAKAAEAPA